MRIQSIVGLTVLALLFTACVDAADTGPLIGAGQASMDRGSGGTKLPTCTGPSDCAAGVFVCAGEDQTATIAPIVITDYSNGLSSDGRGSYVQGSAGVNTAVVSTVGALGINKTVKNRKYTLNLNNPVPGGGGAPLGLITDGDDVFLETQWYTSGNARQNLNSIPVGQTVPANQIDVPVHINGHYHMLQMGPQPYGHCHSAPTAAFGTGTTTGTIYRASATKWVIDLPAGSIGRLFDLYNTDQYAVDKGLYYTQLHYEIGQ